MIFLSCLIVYAVGACLTQLVILPRMVQIAREQLRANTLSESDVSTFLSLKQTDYVVISVVWPLVGLMVVVSRILGLFSKS